VNTRSFAKRLLSAGETTSPYGHTWVKRRAPPGVTTNGGTVEEDSGPVVAADVRSRGRGDDLVLLDADDAQACSAAPTASITTSAGATRVWNGVVLRLTVVWGDDEPPIHRYRMAPLCQAAGGVAFVRGPGCGLAEEPVVGVEPVALAV